MFSLKLNLNFTVLKCQEKARTAHCQNCPNFEIEFSDKNINSIFNTGKNDKIFKCDVVRIVNVIFIRHLKPFLIEQRIFQGVYGKNMSLKTPEKETSADRMEQRAIIKFCVDSGKTPIETKQMMENTKRHRHISRSLVYKWNKRFSDGVCDLKDAERSGRPLLCDDKTKSRIHDIVMKDRRLTLREVASISDVSKSSVFNILTEDFCMSRVCARWVPRLLSDEHKKDECRQVRLSYRISKKEERSGLTESILRTRLGCIILIQKQKQNPAFENTGVHQHRKR